MENKNYTATIELQESPGEVFSCVSDVSKWWAKKADEAVSGKQTEFEGSSTKLNDEFIIRSGDRHYSKQKLIEVVPGKKLVWLVVDSKLNWLERDKNEWTGTKIIFEFIPKGDKTLLRFTHEGLVPGVECYAMCEKGWDFLIKERLFLFVSERAANKTV
jgi:hypothetical protein